VVACLLKFKAKTDIKDIFNKIPLDYCKNPVIAKLLKGEKVKLPQPVRAIEFKGEIDEDTGLKEGKGRLVDDQGNVYEGDFKNDKKNGIGKMIFSNGDIYEGGWADDQRHGNATQTHWNNSASYTGGWRNNACHGVGVFRWPDGSKTMRDYFLDRLIAEKNLAPNDEKQLEVQEQIRKINEELQQQKEINDKLTKENSLKMEELRTKCEVEQSKNLCIICMDQPRNTVLMPCMHFLYCSKCIQTLKENHCPSCRQPIAGKLQCNLQP